jgi:hypothetical protein
MLDNPFSSLKLPPMRISRRVGSIANGFSDHYGAIETACNFANIKVPNNDFCAYWSHGCFGPWEVSIPGQLTMNYDNEIRSFWLYVGRKDESEQLKLNGFPRTKAIGVPFVYSKEINQDRIKNSLLVLPTHIMPKMTFEDRHKFVSYAQQIKSLSCYFSKIAVCLHANCIDNGIWVNEFKEAGIQVIRGADYRDENALCRVKTLLSTFEYATTNGWGSHVAYALACGAKLSIYGTQPKVTIDQMISSDTCWARNPDSAAAVLSEKNEIAQRDYLSLFYLPPMEGVSDVERGEYLTGQHHRLSPEEMRQILLEAFGKTIMGKLATLRKKVLWRLKQFAKKTTAVNNSSHFKQLTF